MVDINAPYVTADELGATRQVDIYKRHKQPAQDRDREIYSSCDMRAGRGPRGWLTRNETTDRFTSHLIQDCYFNQHIQFIEWNDRINCMVEDGIYISSVNFFMTRGEFIKFLSRIPPV